MLDKRIQFEELYISEFYETTTGYFTIDKSLLEELLPGKYPEAESGEISIEYPTNRPETSMVTVMISPTKDGNDYDWSDYNLNYEQINELVVMVESKLAMMKEKLS